ncbi:hypothetical protein [Blastococcus saxobsidens]|uniref:Uncharacterized protein n=1 Tax=Blastococcus saxobsidens TaxID=138336 RepID=A0A4Q7Y9Q1_9ACTN|nr:hypothetical protein [Blastococcus saxobsidens]RZU33760.1 hypothetical protein BKA19_3495 [Blastococcus saxobsidens]
MGAIALTGASYVGAWQQAVRSLLEPEQGWNWPLVLLYGGGYAVAMVLFFIAERAGWFEDEDEAAARAIVRRALATGELPPDGSPAAWRARLEAELHAARVGRWGVAVTGLGIAAATAAAAVVLGDPVVGLLAAGLAGFVVVPVRWFSRRLARAEELLARVGSA